MLLHRALINFSAVIFAYSPNKNVYINTMTIHWSPSHSWTNQKCNALLLLKANFLCAGCSGFSSQIIIYQLKSIDFVCMMHWFRQSLFGWWFFGLYSIILLNYLVTLLLFFSSFSIWESLFPFTDLLSNNKFFIFHSKCDFSFTLTQYCSCYMIIPWIFVTIGTSKGSRLVFAIWIYDWRLNQLKLHNLKLQLQLQLEFYFTLNQNFNSVESILFTSVQLNQFIVIVRVTFTFC